MMTHSHRSALVLLLLLLVPAALLAVTPAGTEVSVRVQQGGSAINPLVAMFPDGGFVVVWGTGSPKTVPHARLFDATGAPASGEFRLAVPSNQYLDDIVVTADGDFVLVWEQPRGEITAATSVVARRFDRRGVAKTAAFVVHDPSPGAVYNARLAAMPDGGFVVAWTQDVSVPGDANLRRDTYVRTFSSSSQSQGPALRINTGSTADDSYLLVGGMGAAPDGTIYVASDCVCDQPAVQIDRVVPGVGVQFIDIGDDDNFDYDSTLAMAADGSFMVAWSSGADHPVIRARRFSAAGVALGAPFQVNRRGNFEILPHLAALTDGEFAIVWSDGTGRDGDGYGVFSRGFAADGSSTGPDLQVNRVTAGTQFATGAAAADQAVAVWIGPEASFDPFTPAGSEVRFRRLRPF